MGLLLGYDATVAAFVAEQIPQMAGTPGFGPCTAIGVLNRTGELVAGVVFHGFLPAFRSIDVSFAATNAHWLTRALATQIMAYPFDQLKVGRVTTHTPKRNRRARAFIERFGFKREGLIRRGFDKDDAVVSGLFVSEWAVSRSNLRGSRSPNP